MRNPCLVCPIHTSGMDKKNSVDCEQCNRRIDYVRSLGGMTHSVPEHLTNYGRTLSQPKPSVKLLSEELSGAIRMAQPKFRQCPRCEDTFELNEENFGRSAKGPGGFMKICRTCHGKSIQKKKKKPAKTKPSFKKAPPPTGPLKLEIDFTGNEDLYSSFMSLSENELRKPQTQALYLIKQACQAGAF